MSDPAEWLILQVLIGDPAGQVVLLFPENEHRPMSLADAQASGHRYTLAEAQGLVRQLGPGWKINHYYTLVPPDKHILWLKGSGERWSP